MEAWEVACVLLLMEAWEVACVLLLMEAWVLLSTLPINQHLNLKHQLINHTM